MGRVLLKNQFRSQVCLRPLAEVAMLRDVVVLRGVDTAEHRLAPGHEGKYVEKVLELSWRESGVLILLKKSGNQLTVAVISPKRKGAS